MGRDRCTFLLSFLSYSLSGRVIVVGPWSFSRLRLCSLTRNPSELQERWLWNAPSELFLNFFLCMHTNCNSYLILITHSSGTTANENDTNKCCQGNYVGMTLPMWNFAIDNLLGSSENTADDEPNLSCWLIPEPKLRHCCWTIYHEDIAHTRYTEFDILIEFHKQ